MGFIGPGFLFQVPTFNYEILGCRGLGRRALAFIGLQGLECKASGLGLPGVGFRLSARDRAA